MIDPTKTTVILIHGFQTTAIFLGTTRPYNKQWLDQPIPYTSDIHSDFDQLPEWLIEEGFTDIRLTSVLCNAQEAPSIEECSKYVRKQILSVIQEDPDRKVIIIAHSLGGLIIRTYLESPHFSQDIAVVGRQFVECVFTLGTPHQAMTFNRLLHLNLNCNSPDTKHPIAGEFSSRAKMSAFNDKFPYISGVDYYVIGGVSYSGILGNILGTYIQLAWGPNDATVPADSAVAMKGARQKAIVNAAHVSKTGHPAYFKAAKGEIKSNTFVNYVQPVLRGDAVTGANTKDIPSNLKWIYVLPTILIFGLVYFVSFIRWGLRSLRQRLKS